MSGYLLDEHLPTWWPAAVVRAHPELQVWRINDGSAPPTGTLDPDILHWCETQNVILVTNNRTSMPLHISVRVAQGRHMPGIFLVRPDLDVKILGATLSYIAAVMFPREFEDQILHPPLIVP